MNLVFARQAGEDVMGIVALLRRRSSRATRESTDLAPYLPPTAFDEIRRMPGSVDDSFGEAGAGSSRPARSPSFPGLAHKGARARSRRAERALEAGLRRQGVGSGSLRRGRDGWRGRRLRRMIEMTMNRARTESAAFYEALGFVPSHVGFKRTL